jgi:hypothetical protein
VGSGFPAIPRDQLMVLPEEEWKKEEAVLTYRSWADKIMRAESRSRGQ